jgi:hypothetical protein
VRAVYPVLRGARLLYSTLVVAPDTAWGRGRHGWRAGHVAERMVAKDANQPQTQY